MAGTVDPCDQRQDRQSKLCLDQFKLENLAFIRDPTWMNEVKSNQGRHLA